MHTDLKIFLGLTITALALVAARMIVPTIPADLSPTSLVRALGHVYVTAAVIFTWQDSDPWRTKWRHPFLVPAFVASVVELACWWAGGHPVRW